MSNGKKDIKNNGGNLINRKTAEDIKSSLALADAIFESIYNGLLVVNKYGVLIKYNSKFAEMWNIPYDLPTHDTNKKLLNTVLSQMANPEEFKAKVLDLYANLKSESFDLIYFKDGRIFERYSKPIYIESEVIGRVWSFQDVSKQKQAEEDLKHSIELLRQSNSEKDKFFSIIAHDLRNPFNGFLGFTDILKTDLRKMTLNEIEMIVNNMNNSAHRLFGLLTNLLEWSMAKRGLMEINPEKVNLNEIVQSVLNICNESLTAKDINLRNEISNDILFTADKRKLESILRNLISNAIKFTNSGGVVTISANRLEDSINISIKDTGIGMNNDMISDLFKIDKMTCRKGTSDEPSTGLGLILCKELVSKHNGKITVESEEGKGTEFVVSLPLVENIGNQ